jgi:uroporphyrinogen decarboxylase
MDIRIGMAEKYARYGIDILMLGDDVSTQLEMMISPELWRNILKPRLAKVIRAAKETNPNILIFYHGDGNLQAIIPDLIEAGVDILNPVQPECMDPVLIKKQYGDRLSFWGTIGTQTTLPFGTAAEVAEMVKKMIETVGKGGGLLLAPTHMVEPEVPWENIEAFIEAIKKFGAY